MSISSKDQVYNTLQKANQTWGFFWPFHGFTKSLKTVAATAQEEGVKAFFEKIINGSMDSFPKNFPSSLDHSLSTIAKLISPDMVQSASFWGHVQSGEVNRSSVADFSTINSNANIHTQIDPNSKNLQDANNREESIHVQAASFAGANEVFRIATDFFKGARWSATYDSTVHNERGSVGRATNSTLFFSLIEGLSQFFTLGESVQLSGAGKFPGLLGTLGVVVAYLPPFLGKDRHKKFLAAILLTFAALSIVFSSLKPHWHRWPLVRNLSASLQAKSFSFSVRKQEINEIANEHFKSGNFVLVEGTAEDQERLIRDFTQLIKDRQYPYLVNREVLSINVADFLNQEPLFAKDLRDLKNTLLTHKNSIVLVLDGIDKLYTKDIEESHKSSIALWKDFIENYNTSGGHLIGLASEENSLILPPYFSSLTLASVGKEETIALLNKELLKKHHLLVNEEALEVIWQKTENLPQPGAALNLLHRCIEAVEKSQTLAGPWEKALQKRDIFVLTNYQKIKNNSKDFVEITAALAKEETKTREKAIKLKHLQSLQKIWLETKKLDYEISNSFLNKHKNTQNIALTDTKEYKKLFYLFMFQNAVVKKIQEFATSSPDPIWVEINKDVVESVDLTGKSIA